MKPLQVKSQRQDERHPALTSAQVDEFITTRLSAEQQNIAAAQRELMARSAPEVQELINSGSPAWKGRKSLALMTYSKTHVTFAFMRSAEFNDAYGLLDGSGKLSRHIKIKQRDTIPEDALHDYIAQAVRLDAA